MQLDTKVLKTITILFVDDDKKIVEQTVSFFSTVFKNVYTANNGLEGLEILDKYKDEIDIVITDINMPKLNGLDMVRKINEQNINIPIIVTTAHTDKEYLLNAIELNVDKYIAKPVQLRELTINIVKLVTKYKRASNLENLAKNLVKKSSKDDILTQTLKQKVEQQANQLKYYETIVDNFVLTCNIDKVGTIINASKKFHDFFDLEDNTNISQLRCDKSSESETFQKIMLKAIHLKKTVVSTHTLIVNQTKKEQFDVTITPNYDTNGLISNYTVYLDII